MLLCSHRWMSKVHQYLTERTYILIYGRCNLGVAMLVLQPQEQMKDVLAIRGHAQRAGIRIRG